MSTNFITADSASVCTVPHDVKLLQCALLFHEVTETVLVSYGGSDFSTANMSH